MSPRKKRTPDEVFRSAQLRESYDRITSLWISVFSDAEDADIHQANLETIVFLESVGLSVKANPEIAELVQSLYRLVPDLVEQHNWMYVRANGGVFEPRILKKLAKAERRQARLTLARSQQALERANDLLHEERNLLKRVEMEPAVIINPGATAQAVPPVVTGSDEVVIEFDLDTNQARVIQDVMEKLQSEMETFEPTIEDIRDLDNIQDEPVPSNVIVVCHKAPATTPDDLCANCGHPQTDHREGADCVSCVRLVSDAFYSGSALYVGEDDGESLALAESSMPLAREALELNDPSPSPAQDLIQKIKDAWGHSRRSDDPARYAVCTETGADLHPMTKCQDCTHLGLEHTPSGCAACLRHALNLQLRFDV